MASFKLNILLNFKFESEAIRANLHGNKKSTKKGSHFGIRCIRRIPVDGKRIWKEKVADEKYPDMCGRGLNI